MQVQRSDCSPAGPGYQIPFSQLWHPRTAIRGRVGIMLPDFTSYGRRQGHFNAPSPRSKSLVARGECTVKFRPVSTYNVRASMLRQMHPQEAQFLGSFAEGRSSGGWL